MVAEARPGTEELGADCESANPEPSAALGVARAQATGVARIVTTAAVYWLASKAALGLAIEPGYATPVWPAAGFALCAVLLWGKRVALGILLGSAAANFTTGLDLDSSLNVLRSAAVASCIGAGASLQALLGARLIEKFV